ncbi:MAG: hypothetical protein HUU57_12875 [Bdellovibrio sp.]|nr:hypothetical protein [Bdellovibrio sp.]
MYYGFLETISIENDFVNLEFDSFKSSLFTSFQEIDGRQPLYEDVFHISLKVPKKKNHKFELDHWYNLKVGEGDISGSSRRLFINQANEENLIIKEIKKIDGRSREGKDLYRYFSFEGFPPADLAQIELLFSQQKSKKHYVAVYDVGQGNCNAVCADGQGVLFYYDFGADIRTNVGTYPVNQRYCLSHNPFVILSHWDKDHWFASHHFPAVKNMFWIVPDQKIGISHRIFANELNANGKLLLWPNHLTHLPFSFGEIVKCTGRYRNDSGLALHIGLINGRQRKNVLLPGDSAYRYIPNIPQTLHGMVASHHGGNVHGNIPAPANNRCATVFSVSMNPHHGHPIPRMVQRYVNLGWQDVRTSLYGHVGFSNQPMTIGCAGNNCNLQITRWY